MTKESAKTHLGPQAVIVYRALRREVEQGVHSAGGRLPAERDLVTRFEVSRMTLRQALARLATEGLVEARKGSGTYVAHRSGAGTDRVNTISIMDIRVLPEIQAYTLSRGCLLSVFLQPRSDWKPQAERQFLQQVKQQRHRALLAFCSPLEPHNDDLLRKLEHSGVRVLHIEHYRIELPEQNYLLPDFRRAGHMAAVALMLAGYRDIRLVIPKGSQAPFVHLQIEGFGAALTEHRGNFDPEADLLANVTMDNCVTDADYHAKRVALLRGLPQNCGLAVFTTSCAVTMAAAARTAGIRVPEDLGIIAINTGGVGDDSETVDQLTFNRPALLCRAVDEVLTPDWPGLHELVRPIRTRQGTVRHG